MDKNSNALADMISTYCEGQMQLIYTERWKNFFLMERQYFIGSLYLDRMKWTIYQTRN